MKLAFLILNRFLRSQNKISKLTFFLSLAGITLGVACLVVSMAVVSGVQSFMQNSVIDLTGHLIVTSRNNEFNLSRIIDSVNEVTPIQSVTPYVSSQGVLVKKGQISGVMIHGLEVSSALKVLSLDKKVLFGELNLDSESSVWIGKELAKKFDLKVNDSVNLIVPRLDPVKSQSFNPQKKLLKVTAILDFGKFDYNDKVIITRDTTVQSLNGIESSYLGAYINLKNPQLARDLILPISDKLGPDYRARTWWDLNQNFFTAVELEKIVIFIVVLFIVIVASMNVSNTLFINVLRKYFDIAILRTLGATEKFLVKVFLMYGAFVGLVSIFCGLTLGWILTFMIKNFNFLDVPGEIYNFDHLPVDLRIQDLFIIGTVTFLICLVASWIPANRGAKLKPSEGIKYEST